MSKDKNKAIHDLRREFQNLLGLLKIVNSETQVDRELKEMIELGLTRESLVLRCFEQLEGNDV